MMTDRSHAEEDDATGEHAVIPKPLMLIPDDDPTEDFLWEHPEIDPVKTEEHGEPRLGLVLPTARVYLQWPVEQGAISQATFERKLADCAAELRAIQPQADAWLRSWIVARTGAAQGKYQSNYEPRLVFPPNDPWLGAFAEADEGYGHEAAYQLQANDTVLAGCRCR
jgi:hypothetical protein